MAKWKHKSTADLAKEAVALRKTADNAAQNGETKRAKAAEDEIKAIYDETFRRDRG